MHPGIQREAFDREVPLAPQTADGAPEVGVVDTQAGVRIGDEDWDLDRLPQHGALPRSYGRGRPLHAPDPKLVRASRGARGEHELTQAMHESRLGQPRYGVHGAVLVLKLARDLRHAPRPRRIAEQEIQHAAISLLLADVALCGALGGLAVLVMVAAIRWAHGALLWSGTGGAAHSEHEPSAAESYGGPGIEGWSFGAIGRAGGFNTRPAACMSIGERG